MLHPVSFPLFYIFTIYEGYEVMKKSGLQKLFLVLTVIFGILTIAGGIYVIMNNGQASPGYACIPMVFTLICSSVSMSFKKH